MRLRRRGVELQLVLGTWADPRDSFYEVTLDGYDDWESCSVRIQRPNGDIFDRPSVIRQVSDWTIVWGQKYILDTASSNEHKLQWNHVRGGSGFVWQRVASSYNGHRRGGKAREGNWNSSWARWRERKVYREDWEEAWDKAEFPDETLATTASEHDSSAKSYWEDDVRAEEDKWKPTLQPAPIRKKANKLSYFDPDLVAPKYTPEEPTLPARENSFRPGQYIVGCVSFVSVGDLKDMPVYAGHLKRFDKEKNSGVISSPGALADFKQNVYVHGSVLHNSKVSLKDLVCFAVHTNAHGKPQASRPLLRLQAHEGKALRGSYREASAPDDERYAGFIHSESVAQLFDWDVQVSFEEGKLLQTGDEVEFNARWIYIEDGDGKLEAFDVVCKTPQPPPGLLDGVPEAPQPDMCDLDLLGSLRLDLEVGEKADHVIHL